MRAKVLQVVKTLTLCFLFLFFFRSSFVRSEVANVFVDPEITYITDGIGSKFAIDLEVDENADSLKGYKLFLSFNGNISDVDSAISGSLLPSAGSLYNFEWDFVNTDSNSIFIRSVIIEAGVFVSGPGVLATVFFEATGSGISDLDFDSLVLFGARYGDTLASTTSGGVAYLNVPPDPFNLLTPEDSLEFRTSDIDSVWLDWEDVTSIYPGNTIHYELNLSTSEIFDPDSTSLISGLTESEYWTRIDTFTKTSSVYWKVKAYDTYGFYTWSNQTDMSFEVITYICGDANGNGEVTIVDAVYLVIYLFRNGSEPVPVQCGDANCSGETTIADVVYIIIYLFNSGPPPCDC